MTMTFDNPRRLQSARPGVLQKLSGRVLQGIASLLAARRSRAASRRTLTHLVDMEDWQLEDIGLTRHEVERAGAEAGLRRDPPQLFDRP